MDAYHKKSKMPHIEVIDITKTDENIPDMLFEVNDAFLELVKKEKNIDNVSQELLSAYVHELIMKCANEQDDFSYEKITEKPKDL